MATTDLIAAIEIGSSKIAGVAGTKDSNGNINVLALAKEDSSLFVRKGIVLNIDKAAGAIRRIIDNLENKLSCRLSKAYICIGGQSVHSIVNEISRGVGNAEKITEAIVNEINDENWNYHLRGLDNIDSEPQEYKVDKNLVVDPIGAAGNHITGQFLNIVANETLKRNLEQSLHQAGLKVADMALGIRALAMSVLTNTEKRSGCALVDLGADTTTVAIYKDNILRYLSVIPLGSNNITRDITSLQIEERDAEKFKELYGTALYDDVTTVDLENGDSYKLDNGCAIKKVELIGITAARTEEIFSNVWNQIKESGYDKKLISGVILTGGGSNLQKTEEAFRKVSKKDKVRTAHLSFANITGKIDEISADGTMNTLIGLLIIGNENCKAEEPKTVIEESSYHTTTPINSQGNDDEIKEQAKESQEEKLNREREEKKLKEEEEKKLKDKGNKGKNGESNKVKLTSWIKNLGGKTKIVAEKSGDLFKGDLFNPED